MHNIDYSFIHSFISKKCQNQFLTSMHSKMLHTEEIESIHIVAVNFLCTFFLFLISAYTAIDHFLTIRTFKCISIVLQYAGIGKSICLNFRGRFIGHLSLFIYE